MTTTDRRTVNLPAAPKGELTDRQMKIVDFIRWHHASFHMAPTIREIGDMLGIKSTNGVNDHLRALEKKGWISRRGMKARSIVLVDDDGTDNATDILRRLVALADTGADMEGLTDFRGNVSPELEAIVVEARKLVGRQ